MLSPFLTKMQRKKAVLTQKNINLGHFKDMIIQHLIAMRLVDGEIVDIDFGLPSKGYVPLEIYTTPNKETVEDQVDKKTRGKKR